MEKNNKTCANNGYNSWLIASGVFCILRKLTKKAPDAWPQVIAGTVGVHYKRELRNGIGENNFS